MTFFIQHQYFLSLFSEEAQCFVYERQADPTILTSFFNPGGEIKQVTGGFEIRGRWHFASGADYCKWGIVGGAERGPDGRIKRQLNFLLRPDQFKIDRVWNSVGLKGTGQQRRHRRADFRFRRVCLRSRRGAGRPGAGAVV